MHFRKDPFCLFVCAVMSKVLLRQLKKNIYTWFYLAVIDDLKCHTCRYIDIVLVLWQVEPFLVTYSAICQISIQRRRVQWF